MMRPTDPEKCVETRTAWLWLRDDGILAQEVRPGVRQMLPDARETIAAVAAIANGQPRACMLDIRGGISVGPGVRELYFSPEGGRDLSALAVLVTSVMARTTSNVILALVRPLHPIRMFTDEERAVAWLQPFIGAARPGG